MFFKAINFDLIINLCDTNVRKLGKMVKKAKFPS